MRKQWFWIVALVCMMAFPVMAQGDIPAGVREGAIDAAEAALGTRSENWRYQALDSTNDSSLGCPLVEGEEMPLEVTVYRVELIYPDGIYVVHVSVDGRLAQLCDSKFGDAMMSPVDEEPDENACMVTPIDAIPAYAAPNNTVDGVFGTTAGTAYEPFGRSSDNLWYQVANDVGIGWVDTNRATLSGDCRDVPVTSYPAPDNQGEACFITPAAAFSNVRAQPSIDGALVAQIFENSIFQVTARTTANDWYYIQPGWVAVRVTSQIGSCNNVTVNDNIVGTGFAEDLPGDIDESVAQALAEYPCPIDFDGYMRPRLSAGFSNAQVEVGNVPNSLRSYPNVDESIGQRLGVIQPGRTIDRIISGPVCNQGFVWWLVEFDGQIGWTAESNAEADDYYIEPMNGEEPATTAATPDASSETVAPVVSDDDTIVIDDSSITHLKFNRDGSRLFIGSEVAGFGDGRNGLITVWSTTNNASEGRIDVPTGIVAMDYASQADLLMVAALNNVVTFYSASDSNIPVAKTLNDVYTDSTVTVSDIAISPDGSYFVVLECASESCTDVSIRVINTSDGAERFTIDVTDTWITSLAINRDGTMIAANGGDGVLFIDVASGTEANKYSIEPTITLQDIIFNADGSQVFSVGCLDADPDCEAGGRIDLIDVGSATLLGTANSPDEITYVALNPDGTRFATVDENAIILRNATTGTAIATYETDSASTSITFTPDGSQVAAGFSNGVIEFYDAAVIGQ